MTLHRFASGLASLALSLVAAPSFAACTVGKFVELPVTMAGLRALVPAKINGTDVKFIIDSGAFWSVINRSKAVDLKLPIEALGRRVIVKGAGGSEADMSLTQVKAFTLDDQSIPNVDFVVQSLSLGGDTVGLLGQNVLGIADVEYDLANGVIRLAKSAGDCSKADLTYWARGSAHSRMDISPSEPRYPHTVGEAYVNGVKIRVVFDTGAPTSILTLSAAARAGIKPDSPGVKEGGPAGGIDTHLSQTWIAPFASFKIGDEEIRNTHLRIGELGLNFQNLQAEMLLGADFFLSHRIYVSNKLRRLFFTYNGGPVFNLTTTPQTIAVADPTPGAAPAPAKPDEELRDAEAFSRRGAAETSRRDFEHAIADFSRAIEMAPSEPKYYYQRASARNANRQQFLAMSDLDQSLKLAPTYIEALLMRAAMRISGRDLPAAAADLDAASKAATKGSDFHLALGTLYMDVDRPDASIAEFDLWMAANPESNQLVQALNGRCWSRALAGRELDKALNDCNRAVSLAPKAAALLDSRGLVRLRMGDIDKAIADYDAALALQPKIAWSLYGRGIAKQRKGMVAEGKTAIALNAQLPALARKYKVDAPNP